eukprot:TRINITY_DN17895_c0_g1_i2.p3 TRINITY_DN17895_c0_g1~~TRINITY_DN17895_c0_g1_i2.p3  ORF type:complete len:170 (-),score=12.19 TRINITY_DN17895_c0_g1_i2:214-723(-)
MLRRPPRSTHCISSAASDVYKRQGINAEYMGMVADTGDWERSTLGVVMGQSGQPLSPHYKDQWPRYYVGKSYPMQFGRVEAKDVLRLVPEQRGPAGRGPALRRVWMRGYHRPVKMLSPVPWGMGLRASSGAASPDLPAPVQAQASMTGTAGSPEGVQRAQISRISGTAA